VILTLSSSQQDLRQEVFDFLSASSELRHALWERWNLIREDPSSEISIEEMREILNYTSHTTQGSKRYSREWTKEELDQLPHAPVIMIDHIPFYKPFGTCVDDPVIRLTL